MKIHKKVTKKSKQLVFDRYYNYDSAQLLIINMSKIGT